MRKFGDLLLAAFTYLLFAQSPAWGEANGLKGFETTMLEVRISNTPVDGNRCANENEFMKKAIAYPISVSGLKVQKTAKLQILTEIFSLYLSEFNSCVSYIQVSAYTRQVLKIAATNVIVDGPIVLWEESAMVWGPRTSHNRQVREMLEAIGKNLVVDWASAQE